MEIALISIATNGYTKYWLEMINGFISNMKTISRVEVHILTDDPTFVKEFAPKSDKVVYKIHSISSDPWPMATLLRYEYILTILDSIRSEKFMYVDADMRFYPDFDLDIPTLLINNDINFVSHPGYWRAINENFPARARLNLKLCVRDLYMKFRIGSLGDWETRKTSTAFVARKNRGIYVCGGIWFGSKLLLCKIVCDLAKNTRVDLANDLIAKWHDESHLNQWYTQNGGKVLTPEYCFDPTYSHLQGLSMKVEAVNKGEIVRV